jgi:glucokinase
MAGEIGHVRVAEFSPVGYGKAGSFEGFCSGNGIKHLARTKVVEKLQMGEEVTFCKSMDELDKINAHTVADAADGGDELAKEIYEICGEYLGKGLSVIIDILNPDVIIIGSIFTRPRELLWPVAEKIINQESLSSSRNVCKILSAQLEENIGNYAALAVALND